MRPLAPILVAICLAATASPAPADVLILTDGRLYDEIDLKRDDEGELWVDFENGEVRVPSNMVRDVVFDDPEEFVPRTEEERERLQRGQVMFEGRWTRIGRRDRILEDRLEEKMAEIAAAKEMRQWRNRHQEETEHYVFHSTLPPHVFEYFRDLMEAYTEEFLDTWEIRPPRDMGKLTVKFYADREMFHQISGLPRGVLGAFRFVEPFELNIFYDRNDLRLTEEVMYHEVGHYLHKLLDPGFKTPHFPGESVAEYYAASRWHPKEEELETGLLLEHRVVQIRKDIDNDDWMGLERMITTDGMGEHYSWGWSLVHFCMSDRRYRDRFIDFFSGLCKARDIDRTKGPWNLWTVEPDELWRAFKDYMKLRDDEDVAEFEKEWREHVDKKLYVYTPRGLARAGDQMVREDRPLRAKEYFEEAIYRGSTDPRLYDRFAELLEDEDDFEGAIAQWRKAVEFGPLSAEYYIALGKALIQHNKGEEEEKEEGKRLLRLAFEIDPENWWLERNLDDWLEK